MSVGEDSARAPSRGGRRRLSAAERRRQIGERSVELLLRYGSSGVSMQSVADAVGLTLPGLLHHVRDREELLTLVIETQFDQDPGLGSAVRLLDTSMSFPEVLRRIVELNSRRLRMTQLYLLLAVEAQEPSHPAHAYYVERHERVFHAFTTHPWALPPRFRPPDALADLVRTALSALDGVQLQALTEPRGDAIALWNHVERTMFGSAEWNGYR